MKISFVSIENGIIAIGFRKMASMVRSIHPETEVCYISPEKILSFYSWLGKSGKIDGSIPIQDLENIARHLSEADMVCFSSMTPFAELTKQVISAIRRVSAGTFIVWGGIHPIINPEDAINYADAICVGEGEYAFQHFLYDFKAGKDFTSTKNFWFNVNGDIIKNEFLPLHKPEDMDKFLFPLYADGELIYKNGEGFVPLSRSKYVSIYGVAYWTIWSIGCPNKCVYCSNSKFIENDKNYRKLRHPSVDYIIVEVKSVIEKHPHISLIYFTDDSFMAIPFAILEEFAKKWRKEVNIPFCVAGVIPAFVKKNKMKVLVWAGMNRVRMGIQSGSDRILDFYKRPNKPGLIHKSASIISGFSDYMIPPTYDIILDNPIENRQDVFETLNLLYNLPRPFSLNIFALKIIPNTELAKAFTKLNISGKDISDGLTVIEPTLPNAMVHMIVLFKLPKRLFEFLLQYVKPYTEEQPKYPFLFNLLRILHLFKRGIGHLRYMDFSVFPGEVGWVFWKLGIIKFWNRKVLKDRSRLRNIENEIEED